MPDPQPEEHPKENAGSKNHTTIPAPEGLST